MVTATNVLGGGQHGLGYLFSQYKTHSISFGLKDKFNNVSFDICGFVLQKTECNDAFIPATNKGQSFYIPRNQFFYNGDKPYIPKNVDQTTLPILLKIIGKSKEVFEFRSSASKGMKHKIAFWAGASSGIHPRYFKITNTGEFSGDRISHPCGLDKEYSVENLKSVFCGKLFHWTLNMINGNQGTDQPATLAYFPKVDLSKKWTFDSLASEFGLNDTEKKVIIDWADTRGKTEWFD